MKTVRYWSCERITTFRNYIITLNFSFEEDDRCSKTKDFIYFFDLSVLELNRSKPVVFHLWSPAMKVLLMQRGKRLPQDMKEPQLVFTDIYYLNKLKFNIFILLTPVSIDMKGTKHSYSYKIS